MKDWDFKYMTEAQIAEIEALWAEHGEAIWAYALECVNAGRTGYEKGLMSGFIKSSMIGGAVVSVGAGAVYLGKKVYHKLKKEEPKPWDKPGRDWEV